MPEYHHIFERWEIRITNKAGTQKEYLTSDQILGTAHSIKFDTLRIGGCNEFEMTTDRRMFGDISIGYLLEFHAQTSDQALTRYWKGEILEIPGDNTTSRTFTYRAVGLSNQLKKRFVTRYVEGADSDTIVEDLIGDEISTDTDISSSTASVSVSSPYTLGDVEFELMPASDALAILAEVQQGIEWGVDEDGVVYFRDENTATVDKAWLGTHISEYEPVVKGDELTTNVLIQSKNLIGGALLILNRSDSTGVSTYRKKTELVRLPTLKEPADAWRFAENVLDHKATPRETVSLSDVLRFKDFRIPSGRVQILDEDGGSVNTLDIQAVAYKLDKNGFYGSYDLGDEPTLSLEEEMRTLMRNITFESRAQISQGRIEHTRGEEWRQDVLSDAKQQDHDNVLAIIFNNIKAIDEDQSKHILLDKDRSYVGGPLDLVDERESTEDTSVYVTVPFPSGREIDSVRVHTDLDKTGRINFAIDDDIPDFWINPAAPDNWVVGDGKNSMAQAKNGNASTIYYKDQGVFSFPQDYTLNFSVVDWQATPSVTPSLRYNYVDDNNFNDLVFNNGASFLTITWRKVVSGSPTTIQTVSAAKDADYQYTLTVRDDPTNSTFAGVQIGGTDTFSVSGALPSTAANRVGFRNFIEGGSTQPCWLDYFDIAEISNVGRVYVSRDGGATFSEATVSSGSSHVNLSLSGQPSGTDLVLKATLKHPARLYGWGLSWTADS